MRCSDRNSVLKPLSIEHASKMTVLKPISIASWVINIAICLGHLVWLAADEPKPVSQLFEPPKSTASIVRSVRTWVESTHVLRPSFNDEISSRGFETFLMRLEPTKSHFYKADIDEFLPYKTQLDDQIQQDSIEFAYIAYKRFLDRLEKVLPVIHQHIDAQHDFDLDEFVSASTSNRGYAHDEKDMVERWRKSIKREILSLRLKGKLDAEIKDSLHQRFRQFYLQASRLNSDELLEMYLSSLTNAMDPHTNYKAPQAQERFASELKLEMSGIGAALEQVIKNNLQQAADARLSKNDGFQRQQLDIDAFAKHKKAETISLNESKYKSSHSYLSTEQIIDAFRDANLEPGRIFVDNFYNREVLRVARDYVESITRNAGVDPN